MKEEHKSFLCPEPLSVLYAVGVQQVGREKGLVRKFLISGNPLLVMHPFEGVVGVAAIVSMAGERIQRITQQQM